jgi:hypothetical protein
MSNANIRRWALKFKKDAKADKFTLFRKHLERLGLPDEPQLLLEGTIDVVIGSAAYASLDSQSLETFLDMQMYDPSTAAGAKYALTFDLYGRAFGRILAPTKAVIPDLADLLDHPWENYAVCGYSSLWVSRIDDKSLSAKELARLEKEVTSDLRFDYTEDDLDLWFDDQSVKGELLVSVQEKQSNQLGELNELRHHRRHPRPRGRT